MIFELRSGEEEYPDVNTWEKESQGEGSGKYRYMSQKETFR